MSWGKKITILYLGFITLIIGMVSLSMKEKIDLEMPDYYEQELKFQEKIDKVNRTKALPEQLRWNVNGSTLNIVFPGAFRGKNIGGSIHFLRPSDAALDKNFTIKEDTALSRSVSLKTLQQGAYKMKIEWNTGNETYYNETIITIP